MLRGVQAGALSNKPPSHYTCGKRLVLADAPGLPFD
jgi:hypothetical protein